LLINWRCVGVEAMAPKLNGLGPLVEGPVKTAQSLKQLGVESLAFAFHLSNIPKNIAHEVEGRGIFPRPIVPQQPLVK
jgi:hypothetical protein